MSKIYTFSGPTHVGFALRWFLNHGFTVLHIDDRALWETGTHSLRYNYIHTADCGGGSSLQRLKLHQEAFPLDSALDA